LNSKASKSVAAITERQNKSYFMSLKRFIFEAWKERSQRIRNAFLSLQKCAIKSMKANALLEIKNFEKVLKEG